MESKPSAKKRKPKPSSKSQSSQDLTGLRKMPFPSSSKSSKKKKVNRSVPIEDSEENGGGDHDAETYMHVRGQIKINK